MNLEKWIHGKTIEELTAGPLALKFSDGCGMIVNSRYSIEHGSETVVYCYDAGGIQVPFHTMFPELIWGGKNEGCLVKTINIISK
jgi:hypothetical protein